jgi:hypothetical protein
MDQDRTAVPGAAPRRRGPVPPDVAAALAGLAAALEPTDGALALYAAGSLATGDYRPATSDLDLVAVVRAPLSAPARRQVQDLHRALMAAQPAAARLHCAYPAVTSLADLAAAHPTWAHGRLVMRPLTAIARAELAQAGLVVFGPGPAELIGPVRPEQVAAAARDELGGYWRPAARWPWRWRADTWVDLGLLTLARGTVTAADGRLLTKSQALALLPCLGVPDRLVEEIARRRRGEPVPMPPGWRARRALLTRRLVSTGIDRALSAGPGRPS